MTTGAACELTVIIAARNAAVDLHHCLTSVFANHLAAPYEVIVVDDGSTDDTARVAAQFPCKVIQVSPSIGAASCRNLGAQAANGQVLLFFDADQLMRSDTLVRFLAALQEEPEVDAVVASFGPDTPARGFFSRFKNYRHHWVHQQARREGATLASGFTAIRREVFTRHGGFEASFGPSSIEDLSLGFRLFRSGHRIRFRPEIQVTHLKSYTFRGLIASDVLDRAIPWTQLALRDRVWRNDLNTSWAKVVSVVLAWSMLGAPLLDLGLAGWWFVVAVGGIGASNGGFLWSAYRQHGAWFAVRALALLPVMYGTHGAGFVAGVALYAAGAPLSTRPRRQPQVVTRERSAVVTADSEVRIALAAERAMTAVRPHDESPGVPRSNAEPRSSLN